MKITIIGSGYVGLTTGLSLAYLGHEVTLIDRNHVIIEKLRNGVVTIHEAGLGQLLKRIGRSICFSTRLQDGIDAQVIMIAVGTPCKRNGDTDLCFVEAAAEEIGEILPPNHTPVVVIKSTVPIGSARRVKSIIELNLKKRGVENDFFVASNPEFLREGVALQDTLYPDRIVMGADEIIVFDILRQVYLPILEQSFEQPTGVQAPQGYGLPAYVTTNLASAELIKYAANSFLAIKISFINEFAGLAERVGADIREVALGIGLDRRIGTGSLAAGAGWGGSCFPKDTQAILYTGFLYDYSLPLVDAAIRVNKRQRKGIVDKLQSALKVIRGNTIGIMGLAFKPGTDDLRDSPPIEIAHILLDMGAHVRVYDPVAMYNCMAQYPDMKVEYASTVQELATGCDALALITDWREFASLDWDCIGSSMRNKVVVDGRNMLSKQELEHKGFTYIGIGTC